MYTLILMWQFAGVANLPTMTIPFQTLKACTTALKDFDHSYGDTLVTIRCVDGKTGVSY